MIGSFGWMVLKNVSLAHIVSEIWQEKDTDLRKKETGNVQPNQNSTVVSQTVDFNKIDQ